MSSVKTKKSPLSGLSTGDVALRKAELEKELVKYRLSLDVSSITVTGGYPALLKEIKSLGRASAKSRAESGK
jgi:hypothetical protein